MNPPKLTATSYSGNCACGHLFSGNDSIRNASAHFKRCGRAIILTVSEDYIWLPELVHNRDWEECQVPACQDALEYIKTQPSDLMLELVAEAPASHEGLSQPAPSTDAEDQAKDQAKENASPELTHDLGGWKDCHHPLCWNHLTHEAGLVRALSTLLQSQAQLSPQYPVPAPTPVTG